MTKKILALALAGTTAFSVFAGALSVNAAVDAYAAYVPVALTVDNSVTDTFTTSIGGVVIKTDTAKNFKADVAKIVLTEDMSGIDCETIEKGKVYLLDYQPDGTDDDDDKAALRDVLDEIAGLGDEFAGTGYSTGTEALDTLTDAIIAYLGATPTLVTGDPGKDTLRRTVRDAMEGFEPAPAANYERTDVTAYNYAALVTAIEAVDTYAEMEAVTPKQTSELMYLLQEYDRIIELMTPADSSSAEDKIERYITVLDARDSADYDKASSFTKFLGKYEALQEKYETASTTSKLNNYATDLYSLIKEDTGKSAGVDKADLKTLIDVANDLDERDYTKAQDDWDYLEGILTEATTIYKLGKSASYQSTVDAYVTLLSEAIDALSPNSSVSDWLLLRIETAISDAESLVESDYTTASWKTLQSKLTSAQKILESSRPSKTTIENAAEALETAIKNLKVKPVSAAARKELKNAIEDAKDALASLGNNATGYQATALTKAIGEADDLWSTKYTTLDGNTTISNVEDAIAALEAAMTSAAQPQGWYTTAEGKWMYGEGDGYYVDGWKKIGNFWFFFNADGTAKQNEWFQDGSNWYYCGNSCVAYSGWGKVDGSWYYFSKANVMRTGWIRPSNSYYYLNPTSGKMVTGWAQIGGKWYYFSTDSNNLGAMLTSTTTPDGYQVGADGAMI